MRTDVKLGVVVALVMVLAAGGYFMFRGEKQAPISLTSSETPADAKGQPAKPAAPTKTATNPRTSPNANRPANPRPNPNGTNPTAGRTNPPATNPAPSRPAVTPTTPPETLASQPSPKPMDTGSAPSTGSPAVANPAVTTTANPAISPSNPTTMPSSLPSASPSPSPSTLAAAPASGKDVPLTGISGSSTPPSLTSPSPSQPPTTMTPLSNSPGAAPASNPAPVVTTPNPNSAIPPGIRPATSPSMTESSPAPKSTITDAAMETHKVQTGDSLTSLAQTYYGDTKYAKILADANPKLADPNRLNVGALINIPALPANADALLNANSTPGTAEKPDPSGKRTYTVKSGDSFYSIAKSQLGNASRWKELLALNNSIVNGDPTSLRPGQRLVLPESR